MATVTLLASDGLSSASPTITSTATITAVVGDWLLVAIAANNREPDGSSHWANTISDSDGINTYITRVNVNYNPAGINTGATVILVTAAVTDALTNATISMTWDTAAFGAGAYQIFRIRPGAGEGPISFVAADTTGSTGNATLHSAATVSVALGNMIFGAAAIETNIAITGDSDTSNGSWSALSTDFYPNATDHLGMTSAVQWKTVTGTGNQSWSCSTTSAKDSARSYLVLHLASAAYSLVANQGGYNLNGTAMTPKLGNVPIVAGAGSYALTGTAATFINTGVNKSLAAGLGSYALTGTDATLTHGYKLDATTAGSYALTGTDATLRRALPMVADAGSYSLTGTDATLTKASLTNKVLGVDSGVYALTGIDASLRIAFKVTVDAGSYILTGSDVALSKSSAKVITAEAGSYALIGTDATMAIGAAAPSVSPLHIGEWPIDKKKRQRREAARAQEQKAKDRFRRAIERLLEGLPPEFDEPADLDEALDSAVQAGNLLYAMSAPIREINAVNELIDHIRQLRIAQPIAQLHLAQAYNQAHRHLAAKAEEDTVLTLLLGE